MKRITTGFLMSLVGSVLLLLQLLGIKVDAPYITEIAGAACAVLVVLGVVVSSTAKGENTENTIENNDESGDITDLDFKEKDIDSAEGETINAEEAEEKSVEGEPDKEDTEVYSEDDEDVADSMAS